MPDRMERLARTERSGLRLAIICRTVVVGVALVWFLSWTAFTGAAPSVAGAIALSAFTAIGLAHLFVIGGAYDRPWIKYAVYAADTLGVAAVFAFAPLYSGGDVPQIFAFRVYGVHYLIAPVALACLSLSWGLVLWTGFFAVAGWWAAFFYVASEVENPLSWVQLTADAGAEEYIALVLSPDFIGRGNRIEETAILIAVAGILALAVFRARRVFFAQVAAEDARQRASAVLGQYVPEAVAARLMEDGAALRPQVRDGVALVMDVADFTAFAASRKPEEVIGALNDFLSAAADAVAARSGIVISFTGDGLLATFGAPLAVDAPERAALDAAEVLRREGASRGFAVRVGVAAGPIAAGSVGSARRRSFTVYGDTVNRASRLEGLAKSLDVALLMDQAVARATGAGSPCGGHRIRGFAEPVEVYSA